MTKTPIKLLIRQRATPLARPDGRDRLVADLAQIHDQSKALGLTEVALFLGCALQSLEDAMASPRPKS